MRSKLSVEYTFRLAETEYLLLAQAVAAGMEILEDVSPEEARALREFLHYVDVAEEGTEETEQVPAVTPEPERRGLLARLTGGAGA